MPVLRYRRSSDDAWMLLDLPAGPAGPIGDKGLIGLTGAKGGAGILGPGGDTGDRGPTGGGGDQGDDGDPTSGTYGTARHRILWGAVHVNPLYGSNENPGYPEGYGNGYTKWVVNFGFNFTSLSAICTGVKNNWGNSAIGAAITQINPGGLVGVVRNNVTTRDDCYVAWMVWGTW